MDDQRANREGGGMKYCKLRIAWSVAWGMLCLLLVVLWVRSYSTLDFLSRVNNQRMQTTIGSQSAHVYFAYFNAERTYKGTGNSYDVHAWILTTRATGEVPTYRFLWKWDQGELNVELPHWCAATLAALIGTLSWFRWQFSLRTLLIGMTVAAVGLSLVVYLIR